MKEIVNRLGHAWTAIVVLFLVATVEDEVKASPPFEHE